MWGFARHRAALVVVAAALAVVAGQSGGAGAQTAQEVAITQEGWWNLLNTGQSTPVAPLRPPPAPDVPPGALAFGSVSAEPDRVAAIRIDPDDLGERVTEFVLTLRESTVEGAVVNPDAAVLRACPITAFWVGGANGAWPTVPDNDCGLAQVAGNRADDGTWTFDLRDIGQMWADGDLNADGVVIAGAANPVVFRIAFEGAASGGIGVTFVSELGEPRPPTTSPPVQPGTAPPSPSRPIVSIPPAPIPPLGAPPVQVPVASPTTTIPALDDSALGNLVGGLNGLWFLLPILLAAALALSLVLGPEGRPTTLATTGRGVRRALAARAALRHTLISEEP